MVDYPEKPVDLTDSEFDDFIRKYPLVLIDFWAPWCGPCRLIKPVIESLAGKYRDKIAFGRVNVDSEKESAGKFGVMSIPTLILFRKGKMIDRLVGAIPEEKIEERVNKFLV